MPRDASGNYTLPAGNPVVPNTIIATNWANTTMQDIADALTNSLSVDGSVTTDKIADDAVTPPKLNGVSANGFIVQNSATEFRARTILGTSDQINVTNGTGAAGDPVFSLPDAPIVKGLHLRQTASVAAFLELGNIDNAASSPYIDFHSGTDGGNDYDARLIATGGNASDGQGALEFLCQNLLRNGSEIYSRSLVFGAVNLSGGIPTGAIIENGANANGGYTKFTDGTLLCYNVLSHSDINTASGSVYTSTEILWTYPHAFVANPAISPRMRDFGGTWAGSGGSTTSTTQCVVQAFAGSTFTGGPYGVEVIAVGRWI